MIVINPFVNVDPGQGFLDGRQARNHTVGEMVDTVRGLSPPK